MSVDPVERNNQYDALRAADEHERELQARHRKEISDLQKRHMKDVEKIKSEYSEAMENLTDGSSKALSEREQRHIRDVQNLQEMNRKRLTQQKAEDEDKYYTTRNTLEGELERAKEKDTYDQDRLTKHYGGALSERDRRDQEMEERYREEGHEAYVGQGQKLREKAERDEDNLRRVKDGIISQKDRELSETRRNRDRTVGDLKVRMEDQRKALSDRYRDNLQREQQDYAEHLDNLQGGFQHAISQNKEKYKERTEGLADQYHDNFEKLKDSNNSRVNSQIDSVRRENQALQDKLVLNQEKNQIQKSVETDHLVGEYQNKFEEIENRRQMAAKLAHQEKTRDIEHLQMQHGREDERRTVEFANKLSQQQIQNEVNLEQKVGSANRDRDLIKLQTDIQKKKVVDTYADKTNEQTDFYDDQMTSRQLGYEKMLGEQRGIWEKEKASELGSLQNELAKENVAHQEKLMDTIQNYEKQINVTKQDYEKKLRHQADLFRDQTDRQVKAMQVDREASESKLQARMAQQKENYERELEQLRKRQLTERQDLAMRKS